MYYKETGMTKDELVDSIDTELAELEERTGFPDRDADYFHRLEIMTFARNAIYNIPISPYQADLIERQGGCSVLDDIYRFWRDHVMEWGETHDEKLTMSFDLVRQYIGSVERRDLTHALYDRASADVQGYTAELRGLDASTVLMQSRYFTAYNAALSMLEPDKKTGSQGLLLLLTYDRPVKAICDTWQNQKNTEVVSLQDLSRALVSVVNNRKAEFERNPESIRSNQPETQRYIDLYVSQYGGTQARLQSEPDRNHGLEP